MDCVKQNPFHYDMIRRQVADKRDGHQVWRMTASISESAADSRQRRGFTVEQLDDTQCHTVFEID
jgi:hypothetical protein